MSYTIGCMQLGMTSSLRRNWSRALFRLWLLLGLGWVTTAIAWIAWDAFEEYRRFNADRTMEAWEVEFRSIHGMSYGEWCGKTAFDRARAAQEECRDGFRPGPFPLIEDCIFVLSKCTRPLLSLPPEGLERVKATVGSILAYLAEHGPMLAFWIGGIAFLPPLALLVLGVFFVAPLGRWVIAGLRD
jgi:hypothetical protein